MKRTIMIIVTLLALTLPVATSAYSSPESGDSGRRNSRDWNDHEQFHRALEAEHRGFHKYNKIDDWRDRAKHRRFHRYLEAKHRREHAKFCDDCWRWFSRLRNHNYDEDNDWDDHRRNSRRDHH